MNEEELGRVLVDSAIRVHRELGPGLLESTYEVCLAYELSERGLDVRRQVALPIRYRGRRMDAAYRIDLLLADRVVVEIKAVERWNKVYEAQLLNYLRLSGCRLGYLLNFNVRLMKEGIRRMRC